MKVHNGSGGIVKSLDKLYEFERAPVAKDKLQPGRYFAALLSGEHVAGTEFVIGALFVSWGASAFDIFVGLLLGNLMAVLTWTFICVPIAVGTRLTLYWYLRKIAGPLATAVYNILNAVLFCILAGCMITVSASALREKFGFPVQVQWYPTDFRFVLLVLLVGSVVVTLAILGFKKLSQFASVCSPWLLLMFIAGAVAILPKLAAATPGVESVKSFKDFWTVANHLIWTGQAPAGQSRLSFWHIAAFAWICNLAMHGGLSDMALFRYAKRISYGFYSAFGMFLGHYLAWICAGIMGAATALILKTTIQNLDAGAVANTCLGTAGLIAVVIAGWTTSNPTMYRAGLAFQAVTPGWPRWLVTLIAGVATTIIACFPFVFTKLLGFVGWYGLLLMPVGAIVFTEHWIFPKIGLTQYWVSHKKLFISWPALLSWGLVILFALIFVIDSPLKSLFAALEINVFVNLLERTESIHLFFLFLPAWFITSLLYIVFACFAGAREKVVPEEKVEQIENFGPSESKLQASITDNPDVSHRDWRLVLAKLLSFVSLILFLILPLWAFFAAQSNYEHRLQLFKKILIWPTLVYFIAGTFWIIKKNKAVS